MKNIYFLLLLMCPFLFQSCLKEEKDLFDETPSERMEKALSSYKEVLSSSENGWLLQYYAEDNQSYGGYNFAMKFTSSTVTAYFELSEDLSEAVESLYQLISDDGPVLSFDTYNMFLHFFSNPSMDMPDGFEGDYEFILMGISDDQNEIKLKGKKTGNGMILKRLTESPESYLAKVVAMEEQAAAPAYSLTVGDQLMDCSLNGNILAFQYSGSDDQIKSGRIAFCYTDTGILLYEALELNGVSVREFTYKDEQLVAIGGSATINKIYPPLNEVLVNSLVTTTYSVNFNYASGMYDMSETVKSWVARAYEINLAGSGGERFVGLRFRYNEGETCFWFVSNDGAQDWSALYGFKLNPVSDTRDKVIFGAEYTLGLNTDFYVWFEPIVANIIAEGTYVLTTENVNNPSVIKLTSERNPDIWFKVSR